MHVGNDRAMTRFTHGDLDVGLAFDFECFATCRQLGPTIGRTRLALVVNLFEIQILNVWTGIGEAPGDPFGAPQNHPRPARKCCACHFNAGCLLLGEIPDRRGRERQMWVVREQWFAARGVDAIDHPIVRSDAFNASGKEHQRYRGIDACRFSFCGRHSINRFVKRGVVTMRRQLVARLRWH